MSGQFVFDARPLLTVLATLSLGTASAAQIADGT